MKKRILSLIICILLCAALIPASVYAGEENKGLKDIFEKCFRIGSCVNASELQYRVAGKTDFPIREFNSVTCKDNLMPDAVLDEIACQNKGGNTETFVKIDGATYVLSFCEMNHIPLIGKTFVYHSHTPSWFFKEYFRKDGAYVSIEVMNKRLESFIKNLFSLIKETYPDLEIAAWDVCSELFTDNDPVSLRNSDWYKVYGNNEFIYKALEYAQKYKPEGCLLFCSDYNEYYPGKSKAFSSLCADLYEKGLIDAVGLQSHLHMVYTDIDTYRSSIETYASIGCPILITEIDVCLDGKSLSEQAEYYSGIFEVLIENKDVIKSVTFDSLSDDLSLRSSEQPLLFGSGFAAKEAYYAVEETAEKLIPKDFTVTFEMNGHGLQPDGQTVTDGKKATNPGRAEAEGYVFEGWYRDSGLTDLFDFDNDIITSDTIIYAKWSEIPTPPKPVNPFEDVSEASYCFDPVMWAVENNITNGIDETHFAPGSPCTRGQIVTFLHRAAGTPEPSSTENPFTDVRETDYFYKAVLWAVEKGITKGMTENTFEPNTICTRGQTVTFLYRAVGAEKTENSASVFTDVKDGAYYSDAVAWAVKNGITNGMTETTFEPDSKCTRGQIVTFLFRTYK